MFEPNVPEVLTDDVLLELFREYLYQIGAGIRTGLPFVRIRYVLDDNKFGYAYFGQFFFYGDQLYVGIGMKSGRIPTIRVSWSIPSMMNVMAEVTHIPSSLLVFVPI